MKCHAEHTVGFTGARLGRDAEFGKWQSCPDRDPADYGPADDLGVDPSVTACRACGHVAVAHTRGRYSIYGICPSPESPQGVTYQEAILDGADPMEGFYE